VRNSKDTGIKASASLIYLVSFALFAGVLLWWFALSQDGNSEWHIDNQYLPDRNDFQQRIDQTLSQAYTEADRSIGADIERLIDPQAMEAKLAGLTKTVTTSREPSTAELKSYFQDNRENYREASRFAFTQLIFPFTQYGGHATTKAREAKNNLKTKVEDFSGLEVIPREANLTSLELDEIYGQGFGDKLVSLFINNQDAPLPCWSEPITSKKGAHIMCFTQVRLGAVPALETIKSQVTNDWRYWVSAQQPSASKQP
jgi:hypothetical protein